MLKIEIDENKNINLYDDSIQIFLSLVSNVKKKIAFFATDHEEAISLKNKINLFDPQAEVWIFPEFDCPFFQMSLPQNQYYLNELGHYLN